MNKKSFLQKLAGICVGSVVLPSVIKSEEPTKKFSIKFEDKEPPFFKEFKTKIGDLNAHGFITQNILIPIKNGLGEDALDTNSYGQYAKACVRIWNNEGSLRVEGPIKTVDELKTTWHNEIAKCIKEGIKQFNDKALPLSEVPKVILT